MAADPDNRKVSIRGVIVLTARIVYHYCIDHIRYSIPAVMVLSVSNVQMRLLCGVWYALFALRVLHTHCQFTYPFRPLLLRCRNQCGAIKNNKNRRIEG